MSYHVIIPAVGESISSGILSTWHKQDGDHVVVGDLLFTLETDKVSTEVTATEPGILKRFVEEGAEVKIGAIVAEIQDAPLEKKKAAPKKAIPKSSNASTIIQEDQPVVAADPTPITSPSQQKKSEELPDLATLAAPKTTLEQRITRHKLTPLRRKIATQLVSAQQTAAILTTFNEVDMGPIIALRSQVQEAFQKKYGVKLGFMSFFIKAVVEALQRVPQVNTRLEGEELIQHHYYDIGVAVGSEKGLIVPVLRDCDQQSLPQLEQQLLHYATQAREGKIKLADLQGGVFTISNGGIYGSLLSTPILNPPQSGILGMHKIQERPVVINNQIVIRSMMYLALSYDHRLVDGKEAVTFLINVKEALENPLKLFLE